MERHLDQELDTVRHNLIRMSAEVEQMLAEAMVALASGEPERASTVLERDHRVDDLEKRIDEDCYTLLALHHPTASDLRFLIAAMKLTNDLERVGDCSKNIARSAMLLAREPQLNSSVDLQGMSELVGRMVHESLDAFIKKDRGLALAVCQQDDEIDNLYELNFRELLGFMIEEPKMTTVALQLLFVAHNLERIADHATNISEDVIYYLEARDIRHTPEATGTPKKT